VPLARSRMRGTDLLRAEVHYSRLTQRRPKGVELALARIAQFEPVGFGEAERVPCPRLVGVQPGAPDDHVVGLGRSVLMEFRKPLRCDDAGVAALAALAHQTDDCLGLFRFPRTALRTVDVRLVEDHQRRPPKIARQIREKASRNAGARRALARRDRRLPRP